jgi:hypothetical protein
MMRQKAKQFGELLVAILWVIIFGGGTYLILKDLAEAGMKVVRGG